MAADAYRHNVLERVREVLEGIAPLRTALDFGSGDGWFARRLMDEGLVEDVVGVDVRRRRRAHLEPILYDGSLLPFPDRSFDLVYAIDTVHHTPDPAASIREALRCCRSTFLLKDHTYRRPTTKLLISIIDELGNRRFGVPSIYKYQRGWEWLPVIEDAGFALEELRHPILCDTRPVLAGLTNGYQFIGRWRRARP
jgi:SAM-dependent methyltransferase